MREYEAALAHEVVTRVGEVLDPDEAHVTTYSASYTGKPSIAFEIFLDVGDPISPTQYLESWYEDGAWQFEVVFFDPQSNRIPATGLRAAPCYAWGAHAGAYLAACLVSRARERVDEWRNRLAYDYEISSSVRAEADMNLRERGVELKTALTELLRVYNELEDASQS